MNHTLTSPAFETDNERDLAIELTQAIARTAEIEDLTGEVDTVSEMDN